MRACARRARAVKSSTLPSRRRFTARIHECNSTLSGCAGPATADFRLRLDAAATAGAREYGEAFLQRVSHLLVLACVGGILLFRYVIVHGLAELGCWLLLVSAEVAPRLNAVTSLSALGGGATTTSFWDTPVGAGLLQAYETAVYNQYADADDWLQLALGALTVLVALRACYRCCCASGERRHRHHRGRRSRYRRSARRARPVSSPSCSDSETDEGWDALCESSTTPHGAPRSAGGRRAKRLDV